MTRADYLVVGEIRKAHGIKGECFVSLQTDDVEGVFAGGRSLLLGDPDGRPQAPEVTLTLQAAREFKGGLIVRFEDVVDRNAAEILRGRTLLIRQQEARPLGAGEYFLHDLVGLEVRTASGEVIGRVVEVYEGGQGYTLGVEGGERELLIPFSSHFVKEVDPAAGRIVIESVPGLLEI